MCVRKKAIFQHGRWREDKRNGGREGGKKGGIVGCRGGERNEKVDVDEEREGREGRERRSGEKECNGGRRERRCLESGRGVLGVLGGPL